MPATGTGDLLFTEGYGTETEAMRGPIKWIVAGLLILAVILVTWLVTYHPVSTEFNCGYNDPRQIPPHTVVAC